MKTPQKRDEERLEDLLLDWEVNLELGKEPTARELTTECPWLRPELERRINALKRFNESFMRSFSPRGIVNDWP